MRLISPHVTMLPLQFSFLLWRGMAWVTSPFGLVFVLVIACRPLQAHCSWAGPAGCQALH